MACHLLRALQVPRAAFSFSPEEIFLDAVWDDFSHMSRFQKKRGPQQSPEDTLCELLLEIGDRWHSINGATRSRRAASLQVLTETLQAEKPPGLLLQDHKAPRLPAWILEAAAVLELTREDLLPDPRRPIQKAFQQASLRKHPDKGGSPEAFKELNAAYERLKEWAARAGPFSAPNEFAWIFVGAAKRWSPPD